MRKTYICTHWVKQSVTFLLCESSRGYLGQTFFTLSASVIFDNVTKVCPKEP